MTDTLNHWCHLAHGPTASRVICRCGWVSGAAHPAEAIQAGFDHTATATRMALSPNAEPAPHWYTDPVMWGRSV